MPGLGVSDSETSTTVVEPIVQEAEVTENTAGKTPEDAADGAQHQDPDTSDSAAHAGSESPEEGAAAMAAAEDAVVDDDSEH